MSRGQQKNLHLDHDCFSNPERANLWNRKDGAVSSFSAAMATEGTDERTTVLAKEMHLIAQMVEDHVLRSTCPRSHLLS